MSRRTSGVRLGVARLVLLGVLSFGLMSCAGNNACLVQSNGANVKCIQYTGSVFLNAEQGQCDAESGTLTGACPTVNSQGRCVVAEGQINELILRFYGGDADSQMTLCTEATGEWQPNAG